MQEHGWYTYEDFQNGKCTEKELYETFVYMEEAEWFSFADDLKAMFEDKM